MILLFSVHHTGCSGGGFDGDGALNIKALWGGGGARVGDLLYHLLRGRKDHMTRVKVDIRMLDELDAGHATSLAAKKAPDGDH